MQEGKSSHRQIEDSSKSSFIRPITIIIITTIIVIIIINNSIIFNNSIIIIIVIIIVVIIADGTKIFLINARIKKSRENKNPILEMSKLRFWKLAIGNSEYFKLGLGFLENYSILPKAINWNIIKTFGIQHVHAFTMK